MKSLSYRNKPIELIRSSRRSISLQVLPGGSIRVRAPYGVPLSAIAAFMESRSEWIDTQLQEMLSLRLSPVLSEEELQAMKKAAAADLHIRLLNYAALLGVNYCRVTIRAQKSRWGSCSRQGNLNFNCLLMLCPPEVRDYVVVHELCHRLEMNHSARFWTLVASIMPDYRIQRHWLKENGSTLIARLPNCY